MTPLRSYLGLAAIAAGCLSAGFAVGLLWPDQVWLNEPLHSMLEVLGALAAVVMAFVLFERRHERGDGQARRLALGFLGMGLLELFHEASPQGEAFVLLSMLASLVGGLGFALIWLPAAHPDRVNWRAVSWGTVAGSVAIGLGLPLLPEWLPGLVSERQFESLAMATKNVAGCLFLAGAAGWLADYRRLGRPESYLFACLALLFGMGEFMFESSNLWNTRWWFWHLIRLATYVLVLGFVGRGYVRTVSDLKNALAQSKRSERRLAAQYAVTRVLAESSSLTDAGPKLLPAIGESLDWELGLLWGVDEQSHTLRSLALWNLRGVQAADFLEDSRQRRFHRDIGLPGRVWSSGEPAWIPDVVQDANFPRAPYAVKAHLHSAFAFPIRATDQVLGVLEFFSHEFREPDADLLQMVAEVGTKIGQYIERKRTEEALRETEEKLRKEARLAEIARLLGDIGHDVKNMMMPLVTGSALLQGELDECFAHMTQEEQIKIKTSRELSTEVIDLIRRSSRRIQERMREIADTVKGRSMAPQFGPCRVAEVVASVFQTLRLPAEQQRVGLRAEGLEALPTIQADEGRLFNAFYNLVNNGLAEVQAGGSITVRGSVEPDGQALVVSVVDTGRGMSPEVRKSLFSDQAISRKVGGTGLGTKIVKDVVDAHRGQITVDSELGVGTTFRIRLPVDPARIETGNSSVIKGAAH